VVAYRQAGKRFEIGEWLLTGADRCTRLAVRLAATYSRQDEFEADRGAAEMCGSAPLVSALRKLDQVVRKTARIRWNERVSRLQQGEGFSSWLIEELAIGKSTEDVADASLEIDRYSTHPSNRDRIAALPQCQEEPDLSGPAFRLFADPDAVASRLVSEVQRLARIEEERDSRERRRWMRQARRGARLKPLQWLGALIVALACIFGVFAWVGAFQPVMVAIALFGIAGGVALFRFGRYRDRKSLPTPDFEAFKAAWENPDDPKTRKAREDKLIEDTKKLLTAMTRAEKIRYLVDESFGALAQCDYLRAHVASRPCLQVHSKSVEARLALVVASGAFHQVPNVGSNFRLINQATGLRSPSTLWGAGWGLLLLGDWAAAEAILEESRKTLLDKASLSALIAICQSRRNKIHTAIANAQIAFDAAPQKNERRGLLADLKLAGGYLKEAEQRMTEAGDAARRDPALTLLMIRIQLLKANFEQADQWIDVLRTQGIAGHTGVQLGQACETARRDELAIRFYIEALGLGYYPDAHLGLARIAAHRHDWEVARRQVVEAVDNQRTVAEKARGPVEVFAQALQQLLLLEDPVPNARAWIASVIGQATAGPIANQAFLVFGEDIGRAKGFMKVVTKAFAPALPPEHVVWRDAPRDQQPVGTVRPGIHRFWKQ
jgi:tetratricopeptide (TPR) repeat protein